MPRSLLSAPLLTLATVVIIGAAPHAAGASTASLSAGVLTITAGPGETNAIAVTSGNANPLWVEDSAGITPGAGCEASLSVPTRVLCFLGPAGLSAASVVVSLADGNDSFTADGAGSYVTTVSADGGPGDDTITGGSAGDVLRGGDGNDTLGGSSGEDQVFGEAGADTVRGHAGADTVSGGPGLDLIEGDGQGIYGNGGSDTIDSRDGESDRVTCGLGADFLKADSIDVIETSECESIDRAETTPAPVTTPPPAAAPVVAMAATSNKKLAKLVSKSGAAFTFRISGPCTASFKLTVAAPEARRTKLGRRLVTLARGTGQLSEAGTFEGTVSAAAKYRRTLRRLKRLKATLSLSCTSAGQVGRDTQTVIFRR